jgi:hypothetical protein
MKLFVSLCSFLFVGLNAFAATEMHHCVAVDTGQECKYEIAMECPSGFTDGCNSGTTKTHQCVAKKGTIDCAKELAIVCPSGFKDGCNSGNSSTHQCVAVKGTIPCAKEVAMICPGSFIDSCLQQGTVKAAPTKTNSGSK